MEHMPKLMPLEIWRTERFTHPPGKSTVRKWAMRGDIPGAKKIGGSWFVDIVEEQLTTGDELVDAVLRAGR